MANPVPPTQERHPSWQRYALPALAISLAVIALACVSFWFEKERYRERASQATMNVAILLENQLNSTLDKIDIALHSIALQYQEALQSGYTDQIARLKMTEILQQQERLYPDLDKICITDSQGKIIIGGELRQDEDVYVTDRRYFIKAQTENGTQIDGPLRSKTDGQWIIILARPLLDQNQQFTGIVYATIPVQYIGNILAHAELGPKGAATIRSTGLALVYRSPAPKPEQIGSSEVSNQLRNMVRGSPRSGSYIATTQLDNIERSNAYRRLDRYPFYIIVGMATDDYMGGWQRNTLLITCLAGIVVFTASISARSLFLAARRQNEASKAREMEAHKLKTILLTATDGIHVLDEQGTLVLANPAFLKLLEQDSDAIDKKLQVSDWDSGHETALVTNPEAETGLQENEIRTITTQYRMPSGKQIDVDVSLCRFVFEGERLIFASARDVTERRQILAKMETTLAERNTLNAILEERVKQRTEALEHLIRTDPLTELLNRRGMAERINTVSSLGQQEKIPYGILCIDVDFFKEVNDDHGHNIGDQALLLIANIIRSIIRPYDCAARWGGDEFLVLVQNSDESILKQIGERICQSVAESQELVDAQGQQVRLSLSIGGVLAITSDFDSALRQADEALYAVKASGRNGLQLYPTTQG